MPALRCEKLLQLRKTKGQSIPPPPINLNREREALSKIWRHFNRLQFMRNRPHNRIMYYLQFWFVVPILYVLWTSLFLHEYLLTRV
jgi:hypothetical protein